MLARLELLTSVVNRSGSALSPCELEGRASKLLLDHGLDLPSQRLAEAP